MYNKIKILYSFIFLIHFLPKNVTLKTLYCTSFKIEDNVFFVKPPENWIFYCISVFLYNFRIKILNIDALSSGTQYRFVGEDLSGSILLLYYVYKVTSILFTKLWIQTLITWGNCFRKLKVSFIKMCTLNFMIDNFTDNYHTFFLTNFKSFAVVGGTISTPLWILPALTYRRR